MIEVNRQGNRVEIRLNRPEKRNALCVEILQALCEQLEIYRELPEIRVVTLQGNGPIFCAGLDLKEVSQTEIREKMGFLLMRVLKDLSQSNFITIAKVHGAAIAGGAGLMCACDLSVVEKSTVIQFPEVKRGVVAAQVATLLARRIPVGQIRELLFLGETIDVQQALRMGLINRAVSKEKLDGEVDQMVKSILEGSPEAMITTKKLIEKLTSDHLEEDIQHALALFHSTWASEDAAEGIAAFHEGRDPIWHAPALLSSNQNEDTSYQSQNP